MRALLLVIIVLSAGYGGYWFVGSSTVENGAHDALADLSEAGWNVEFDSLSTRGFPSRFDTTLTEFDISDPQTGWGWAAPFVQVFALSYQPNKVIAAFPPEQQITFPSGQNWQVGSNQMRASGSVGLTADLALQTLTAESGPVTVRSSYGWEMSADRALIAARNAGEPATYDLFADLQSFAPPVQFAQALDPSGTLPRTLTLVSYDATIRYDRPFDMHLSKGPWPTVEGITINDARLSWGDMLLTVSGALDIDPFGYPQGDIMLKATEWQRLIEVAVEVGMIAPEYEQTWLGVGGALAKDSETVDLPLTFQNGVISLGLFTLGRTPRFRQRQ